MLGTFDDLSLSWLVVVPLGDFVSERVVGAKTRGHELLSLLTGRFVGLRAVRANLPGSAQPA